MKGFGIYLKLQIKRMSKSFPIIFLMTLLLAGSFGLLAWMQMSISQNDEGKQKVALGIVGDAKDSYLGFGISALEQMDSSRFTVSFVMFDEEAKAKRQLEDGKIGGYILIPEGFVDSVVTGENLPVTYVAGGGQGGMGSQLIRELAESVSVMITETQAGIYGMQNYYIENDVLDTLYEDADRLNLKYFDVVLGREKMYKIETFSDTGGLSIAGYYVCALLLVFLLLWGMNCAALMVRDDLSLEKVLKAAGLKVGLQAAGEFIAYLGLMIANYLGIIMLLAVGMKVSDLAFAEISGIGDLLSFAAGVWPVVLCVSALQFLIYNLVNGLISGLLLNFLGAIVLGYLSGCFYPLSYFPQMIQKLAAFLPTGIAMEYMKNVIRKKNSGAQFFQLLLYTAVFVTAAVLLKKHKLEH
ncbi:MAG: ABC transporter permease [Clostridia bacterium]|nr:ABC transporter permease [Clostridia bacterium]